MPTCGIDFWPQPGGGVMPQNELQVGELMERVCRLFHLHEGRMQGTGQQGTIGAANAFMTGDPNPPDP